MANAIVAGQKAKTPANAAPKAAPETPSEALPANAVKTELPNGTIIINYL